LAGRPVDNRPNDLSIAGLFDEQAFHQVGKGHILDKNRGKA
jgi:hypothetical protein